MNEDSWLSSNDSQAMLAYIQDKASPRRLRLFACACLRAYSPMSNRDDAANKGEAFADGAPKEDGAWGSNISGAEAANRTIFGMDRSGCANLLRDIIGNPFQPIIINEGQHTLTTTRGIVLDRRWLTPTVKALATAAYQERGRGRVCGRCSGRGEFYIVKIEPVSKTKPSGERVYPMMRKEAEAKKCPDCHGTGRVENGQLNNDRLGVLGDALSDAGCPETVECDDTDCKGKGWYSYNGAEFGYTTANCEVCSGTGSVPNPILQHLRSEGPHVRGCWVIDALLGKA